MKKLLITLILALSFLSGKGQTMIDSLNQLKIDLENAVVFDEKQYSEIVNSLIFCYMNISDYYNAKKTSEDGINVLRQAQLFFQHRPIERDAPSPITM